MKNKLKNNVVDTEGRVWRRYAIPEGVTLANGLSREMIEEELRKKRRGERCRNVISEKKQE